MNVVCLSGPTVDWKSFISLIQDARGESPTRVLDKLGLALDNPYSFLTALQDQKNRSTVIELDTLFHASFTFGIHCENVTADELGFAESYSTKIRIDVDKRTCIIILSSSIHDYKLFIPQVLSSNLSKEVRQIYVEFYLTFKNTDFRNLWSDYLIRRDKDNIIYLKEL